MDYWEQRKIDLMNQMETDEKELYEKLDNVYKLYLAKLELEIASYYERYGENNVIKYRVLLDVLSEADRRLLMQDMDEFAKRYPEYANLMPVRESIYKLNRMEGLQYSIYVKQIEIGAIEIEELTEHLEKQARRSANLAREQLGIGEAFQALDDNIIRMTVNAKWVDGKSFSDRIWSNREKLAAYLSDDFAKKIAAGYSYDEIVRELGDIFTDVSRTDIERLVYTEGTFVFNEAHAQAHEKMNPDDKYILSTITDSKACEVCKAIERKQKKNPVPLSERVQGVNFPPLHPRCRCSYTIDLPKFFNESDDSDIDIDNFDIDAFHDYIDREVAKAGGDYIQERDRPDLNYLHPKKRKMR